MFTKHHDEGYRELIPGVSLKTIAHGDRTLLGKFKIRKDAVIPENRHPNEQTGYLVSGCLEFLIDGETQVAQPGDGWCLEADTPHGATAHEDSIVVEVFSPVREDYLP
jgi:quercetin dioxygenase-like cupin family protein